MKTAIVAIEDYRFYEHGAIDIEGTSGRWPRTCGPAR